MYCWPRGSLIITRRASISIDGGDAFTVSQGIFNRVTTVYSADRKSRRACGHPRSRYRYRFRRRRRCSRGVRNGNLMALISARCMQSRFEIESTDSRSAGRPTILRKIVRINSSWKDFQRRKILFYFISIDYYRLISVGVRNLDFKKTLKDLSTHCSSWYLFSPSTLCDSFYYIWCHEVLEPDWARRYASLAEKGLINPASDRLVTHSPGYNSK